MGENQGSAKAGQAPKFRSSCDGCGAAKLKCGREAPSCSRCISIGIPCVYGISRKRGKLPGDPQRKRAQKQRPSSEDDNRGVEAGHDNTRMNISNNNVSASASPSAFGDAVYPPGAEMNLNLTWPELDGYWDKLLGMGAPNGSDQLHSNNFDLPLGDLSALHFNDSFLGGHDMNTSQPPTSIPMDLDIFDKEKFNAQTGDMRPLANLPQTHGLETPQRSSTSSTCSNTCYQEAYEVLGRLSFADASTSSCSRTASSSSLLGTAGGAGTEMLSTFPSASDCGSRISLDQILCLSRDAMEQISALLACTTCSKRPLNTLLHVSILWRILLWYQSATMRSKSSPSPPVSSLSEYSGSVMHAAPPSPLSSGQTTPSSSKTTSYANAASTSQMLFGRFSIDDQEVQNVVKVQLLKGEIRRIGSLIDAFANQGSKDNDLDQGELHRTLSAFLRSQHLRTAELIRTQWSEAS